MSLALLPLLIVAWPAPTGPEVTLRPIGRLAHPALREASGIVASRKHPGVFWVHNDSGNPPRLFAVGRDGSLLREYAVAAPNIDWEDVATDDAGHLYLGDVGNNGARLPLRAVYQIDEPDPREGPAAEAGDLPVLRPSAATHYRFAPGGRFDAEGLVVDNGQVLVVAKWPDRRVAELYSVPLRPPAPLLRPATAEKVATLTGFDRPVTGADLSADGRRLAVCSYDAVGVFERGPGGGWSPLARARFRGGDGIEAIAWDGDDLVLAGEGRGLYRIVAADWRAAHPGVEERLHDR